MNCFRLKWLARSYARINRELVRNRAYYLFSLFLTLVRAFRNSQIHTAEEAPALLAFTDNPRNVMILLYQNIESESERGKE